MKERVFKIDTRRWRRKRVPNASLEVLEVYPGSVAAAAGVKTGQLYIVEQDRAIAPLWDSIQARSKSGRMRSQFIDPVARTVTHIETEGFPWGMRLERPQTLVRQDVQNISAPPTVWIERVLKGSDAVFDELTHAALMGCTRSLIPGFSAIRPESRVVTLTAPTANQRYLLVGAAIAAARRGHSRLARKLMPTLDEALMRGTVSTVQAIGLYGEALVSMAEGKPLERVTNLLSAAFQRVPESKRLAGALTEAGTPTTAAPEHVAAHPMPLMYVLPNVDPLDGPIDLRRAAASPSVSLAECLAALEPHQLGVVIAMSDYRVNGPYASLLYNLVSLYPTIKSHLPFVHVISAVGNISEGSSGARPDFVKRWRFADDLARARNIPLRVLYDDGGRCNSALDVQATPAMFLVDRHGTVHYRGGDSHDGPFWRALDRLKTQGTDTAPGAGVKVSLAIG